jgi:hypothetical protein
MMNPAHNEEEFSDRLVAFLDILGFHHLVMQDKSKALKSINSIDGHLQHLLDVLYKDHGKRFSVKLFSDSMCISCNYTFENVFYIIYELAFIQLYFSLEAIFLRGALSRGSHFENDRMIFSEGLVKAYELEQTAIYPRIVIDKDLLDDIMHDNNSYYPIYAGFKKQEFLIQSPDGQFFIDYLHSLYEEGQLQLESLQKHKESIVMNVKQNSDNIKVMEKYHWLAEYHNYKSSEIFCADDFEEAYSKEILENISIALSQLFPQFTKSQNATNMK